ARAYAFLSGDMNPIHLHAHAARLFGFRSAIIHGMFMLARAAADIEDENANKGLLTCAFKKPTFLPDTVTNHWWPKEGGTEFWVTSADGKTPHLSGTMHGD